jgi:hypothetical protein
MVGTKHPEKSTTIAQENVRIRVPAHEWLTLRDWFLDGWQ